MQKLQCFFSSQYHVMINLAGRLSRQPLPRAQTLNRRADSDELLSTEEKEDASQLLPE